MKDFSLTGTVDKEDLEWALRSILYYAGYYAAKKNMVASDFGTDSINRLESILAELDIPLYC